MPEGVPQAPAHEPLVSVVIPAYNCEAYVAEAIESVLNQTFRDFELIVVDDASTDRTGEVLAGYERAGRIRVVSHQMNQGLAATRNSGIRRARGRYVSFLDADDVWRPEKLEYHVRILRENPHLALFGSDEILFADGEPFMFPPLPVRPDLREVRWEDLVVANCGLSASNVMVRRDCLDEVGLFDPDLRAAEDRDLWLRIARRFPVAADGAVVNACRLHGRNMSAEFERMRRYKRAVLRKAFRQVPSPLRLRARAYACFHLEMGIICYQADRRLRSLGQLARSLLIWPLPLGRGARRPRLFRLFWVVKALLGRRAFERLWPPVKRALGRNRRGDVPDAPAAG